MTLEAGARLGPYEILSPIGAGGMGEVYKARDTRLGRDVAVKVLPQQLSASPELRQRLEREAKTISQLSHPHICTLFDVGEADVTGEGAGREALGAGRDDFSSAQRTTPSAQRLVQYLVMEYLEGETLADRLGKGSVPVEQSLKIGIEIADALDSAHKSGIVHRDLKPGNVMLTRSGVKLLDFGLAKLHAPVAGAVSAVTSLPTALQESQPLTTRGTILGTFQYMSPEQLEGGEADARSDLFAFGCVLYEMLTGQKAFTGKSQASLIGSIMNTDPPPVSSLQPMIPPALDRVVKGCLAKEPEQRWHTAHDVRMQLQWIAEGGSLAGVPAPVAARRRSREKLAWAVAAAGLIAAAALAVGFVKRAPAKPRLVRFEIPTPEQIVSIDTPRLSPDGRLLAFNATDSTGKTRIWIRPLNAVGAQPLAGTEGTSRPFWSPDSRFIGFFAEGRLKKIDVSGGPPQKICDAPSGSDGSWSSKGVILYDGRSADPIRRVSAAGGVATDFIKADTSRKEGAVGWPEFLPDGKTFLYMAMGLKAEDSVYRVGSLDSNETRTLMPAQSMVAYAPPGYLLFVRDRTLVAQPFDAKSAKTTGEPVPLADQVGIDTVGLARFSTSLDGSLAYRTGEINRRLLWTDRTGRELETVGAPGEYFNPALSPAGDRLAYDFSDPRSGGGAAGDIWIRDLRRGVNSRFTFSNEDDSCPVWSPDGKRIVFSRDRGTAWDLIEKPADGQGAEAELLKGDGLIFASDWSAAAGAIIYSRQAKDTGFDIWMIPLQGDRKPVLVLQTPFNEMWPKLSPDGRWIAYQSNESGRQEIYVQSFPATGGKWQISTNGGTEPTWRGDGREIYYRAPDQQLTAVEIEAAGGTFQAGTPRALFPGKFQPGTARNRYLPAPDGQRFLFVSPLGRDAMSPTTVVLNWFSELGQ
jgi:serine/threonine protein kinase/Tol biopolymer transport system component